MKRYTSVDVICPFYKSEDHQKIYCEGVEDGTSIHVAFGSTTHMKAYKARLCCSRYNECLIAQALNDKYKETP